ncbi:MAG TPA: hypothetical protein VMV10_05975 [Pirellulales bacterium]|nr:hypothetical protein [Pirellulales bacterium]
MKTELDRALYTFATRVQMLLLSRGAQPLPDGAFLLTTPAGPLRVAAQGNWIISHFASPLGGFFATKQGSVRITGNWSFYCPRKVETLTSPLAVDDFAAALDGVLAFKPTGGQRMRIEQDLREQRRYAQRLAVMFAAVPDPEQPQREGAEPPGVLLTAAKPPVARKPAKPKPRKAAKPKAKDAKPKRRSRVSARKGRRK